MNQSSTMAATSDPPRTAKGERTRARLLVAAEAVFGELGYADASITKITERAGVAQGTFYVYFPGKQQIFDELVVDLNRRVRRAMSEGAAGAPNRLAAERGGFAAFFRFTAEHPALYRIIRQAEIASPAMLHRHYESIKDGYVDALSAARDAGEIGDVDPEVAAWALMGIGELVGMRWVLWSEDPAAGVPEHVFDAVMIMVERALGRGSDG